MHVVVEMPEFIRQAKQCGISDEERTAIVEHIAARPTSGDEIKGTGGARKIRFPAKGKGKSGGARVISFYSGQNIPVFLLTAYTKGKKENITDSEKSGIKAVCELIVETYKNRRQ